MLECYLVSFGLVVDCIVFEVEVVVEVVVVVVYVEVGSWEFVEDLMWYVVVEFVEEVV